MTVSVHAVADYFILKVDREAGDDITRLKLQKLVYYAQAWHLAMHGCPLFEDRLEAWAHGPVCKAIHARFQYLSFNPIPPKTVLSDPANLDDATTGFLDEVWEIYGQYSAAKLEAMAHQETPWIEARNGMPPSEQSEAPISEDTMASFYRARMLARRRIREK
jgi:uncharacterized phage-associated protein